MNLTLGVTRLICVKALESRMDILAVAGAKPSPALKGQCRAKTGRNPPYLREAICNLCFWTTMIFDDISYPDVK